MGLAVLGAPFALDLPAPRSAERLVGRWEGGDLRLQLTAGGRFALERAGAEPLRGRYLLDATRQPAALSFVVAGSNLHTSFSLQGDDTLLLAGPPFSPARQLRPVAFGGAATVVLRRSR